MRRIQMENNDQNIPEGTYRGMWCHKTLTIPFPEKSITIETPEERKFKMVNVEIYYNRIVIVED